ncbi:MAG TPA: hypothetical protein VFG11_09215 [Acidobacteriota bacterium]|nr:hypothetical protein [Acidobacteriota bacterium]
MDIGRINSQPSFPTAAKITEDIVLDELQGPAQTGDNAAVQKSFDGLSEIFQNLSPNDAQSLLDRLQTNNPNDPIASQFNNIFKGQQAEDLKSILQSRLQPQENTLQDQAEKPFTPASTRGARSEIGLEGSVRQAQLQNQLNSQSNSTVELAKHIANDPSLTPDARVAHMKEVLEMASPDDFKAIFSSLGSLSQNEKDVIGGAIHGSETVAARVGKELNPDEQLGAIRAAADFRHSGKAPANSGAQYARSLEAWAANTTPEALNKVVAADNEALGGLNVVNRLMLDGHDSSLFDKLNDTNKAGVLTHLVTMAKSDEDYGFIMDNLAKSSPAVKNAFIDQLQDKGQMPQFLEKVGRTFSERHLQGMNKENAQFIQSTFELLGKEAEMKKNVDDAIAFQQKALHVRGWIENHFK